MAVNAKPGRTVSVLRDADRIAGLLWVPDDLQPGERQSAIVASFRYATHMKGHGYSPQVAGAIVDWIREWIPSPRAAQG